MLATFKQRTFLGSRTFELHESILVITIHHWLVGKVEKRINLFDINNQIEYRRYYFNMDNVLLGALLFFLTLWITANFIYLYFLNSFLIISLFAILILIVNFIGQVHYLEIKTKYEPIILEANRWNKKKGIAFLEKILEQSRIYFRKQYMFVDADLSEDLQYKNCRWLLMNNLITEEEHVRLKEELKGVKGE